MEDRYEIRGKIGQGGIGSVYRGYDSRMNREVAIKRILTSVDDETLETEATKQLIQEAGALASLQHPHIVTIFDVGADEDGPYVVMELINGKTLDEIIEEAPMTFDDFRELAMQSQEALIAAQELDLIHSDLKPPNIMLTWLPSGRFQVKIVDFGLAVLAQSQSKEELESLEAVFGSIFFMPPEQFEREPLDGRSDLYSIGCVYYQALTGVYPFSGESGTEVMTAHLHHNVRPIRELRADIPIWLCDWVMWLINRYRDDRPENAREALSVFVQNDKNPNPEMSQGSAQAKRPKLIIPGSIPSADSAPPTSSTTLQADSATSSVSPKSVTSTVQPKSLTSSIHESKTGKTTPQALAPPQGSKPSVHTSATRSATPTQSVGSATGAVQTAPGATQQGEEAEVGDVQVTSHVPGSDEKKKMSNAMRVMIAVVLTILVVVAGLMVKHRINQNKETALYNKLITAASVKGAEEVPMTGEELGLLLKMVGKLGEVKEREAIYKALEMAKATDDTNIDIELVEFATQTDLLKGVRLKIFSDVIRARDNPDVVSAILSYAKQASDPDVAAAAFEGVRDMVSDQHADVFLKVLSDTDSGNLRRVAESNLTEIIDSTSSRGYVTRRIISMLADEKNRDVRHAFIRLLGKCSTDEALQVVSDTLKNGDGADRIAAITALGNWNGDESFGHLTEFLKSGGDPRSRERAFESALRILDQETARKGGGANKLWQQLSQHTTTGKEKELVIRGLVKLDQPWAITMLEAYKKDSNQSVAGLAEKGLKFIRDRKADQKKNGG